MTAYLVSKTTKEHFLARNFSPADANDEDLILVKGDAAGWIKWHGDKECPLPNESICEVRLGYRRQPAKQGAMPARQWRWPWVKRGTGGDIIAYRPILDDKPQAPRDCVTVRYDLDPVSVEGAIRDKLIEMGWMPPQSNREHWIEAAKEYFCDDDAAATMEFIYDALKSGELPQP